MSHSSRERSPVALTLQSLLLFVGALVMASAAVSLWRDAAPPLGVAEGTTAFALLRTVAQFVGFATPVALFVAASGDRDLLGLRRPTRRELVVAGGGVVGLTLLQYGLLFALSLVGVVPVENRAIAGDYAPAYFLWMVVVSVLVVGPAEELVFRGAVQGLLKRAWGREVAVVGAGVLFGSLHYSVGSGTPVEALAYVAVAALLGCVLGLLRERTTLVVVMLVHGGYNAVAYGIQYLGA